MAGRNAVKQNFDFIINDKCSWSYKAEKIVSTGNSSNKIESTLTTIHVSQQRSSAAESAPKISKRNLGSKKQCRTKAKVCDKILGLFEYEDDMNASNAKCKFSGVKKQSTPVVADEMLSSLSSCSSENTNVLLSRDVAEIDVYNDRDESEILPELVPHDESSPLLSPNSNSNGALLDNNDFHIGNLETNYLSPFGVQIKNRAVKEPEGFEKKLFSERNDIQEKSPLVETSGNHVVLPYRRNVSTTISSLSGGSPSSDGRIESISNDVESIKSTDVKEDESDFLDMNELAYNCFSQQRENDIADKTLTFADEVQGVCDELKSYTLCTDEEIFDDLMNGTFSVKKYQERERELKAPLKVPEDIKRLERVGADDGHLFHNKKELLPPPQYGSNLQGSLTTDSGRPFLQKETNEFQKMNKMTSETGINTYRSRRDFEHDIENTNASPLSLNISSSNLKANNETNRKRNNEVDSEKQTNTYNSLKGMQEAEKTKYFADASPLGLNLDTVSLKMKDEGIKNSVALAYKKGNALLPSKNEMQELTSPEKIFSKTQTLSKDNLLRKQSKESLQEEHISQIFGNGYKNDEEEIYNFSCKPMDSAHAESLFYHERENERKNSTYAPVSDVEEDYIISTAALENGTVSVIKDAEFKSKVSSEKMKDAKTAHEARFIDSVSVTKNNDSHIDVDLFIDASASTDVCEASFSMKEDTENSIDSSALHESAVTHSEEIFSSGTFNEKSLLVPGNEKILFKSNMCKTFPIETKKSAEKKNDYFLTSCDSESSVKYNLRNKRAENKPKQQHNTAQMTAPPKPMNKNKQNVAKAKKGTEVKKYQAKQKKNMNTTFVTSTPLITPRKRLISLESELKSIETQKKPRTWDELGKEMLQDRYGSKTSSTLRDMVPRHNTCYTSMSRKQESTIRSGNNVKSVCHFSGYAFNFDPSGKSKDRELEKMNVFQAENQTPSDMQPSKSQAIVERTLGAMQKCRIDYMKQVGGFENRKPCEGSFGASNSLSTNSGYARAFELENPHSSEYPSVKKISPEDNFVPLSVATYTKLSYTSSTIQKQSTISAVYNINNSKRNENNVSVKLDSNFQLEDSGFQENFNGNELKGSRNSINSESLNPWEKLEKQLQLNEKKLNCWSTRPFVHYLKRASSVAEENSNLATEEFHHNSIEIDSPNSVKRMCDWRETKNLKVPSLDLENETQNIRNEIYCSHDSSQEYHNDAALYEEDSELKLQTEHNLPLTTDVINSCMQEILDDNQMAITGDDNRNQYFPTQKIIFPNISSNECQNDETVLDATIDDINVKFDQMDDVSSSEDDEKQKNNTVIDVKISNSTNYENKDAPNEKEKRESRQRKSTIRGKRPSEKLTECIRRRRQCKKAQKRTSEDETFDGFLRSSERKEISDSRKPKRYNFRQKNIPTIDLSSDSETDNHKKEEVSTQQTTKSKQSREKYKRYVGKILQLNSQTSETTQTGLAEQDPFENCNILTKSLDDQFSISSGDSDTNLKGVGLLCDILAEQE